VSWRLREKGTFRLDLAAPIPVHNVYFTLIADASGNLETVPDVYGHDRRIAAALAGGNVKAIAASDPALAQKRRNEDLVKAAEDAAAIAVADRDGDDEWIPWGTSASSKKKATSPFKGFFFSKPGEPPRARGRKKTANR
jgi:hypothetical protein